MTKKRGKSRHKGVKGNPRPLCLGGNERLHKFSWSRRNKTNMATRTFSFYDKSVGMTAYLFPLDCKIHITNARVYLTESEYAQCEDYHNKKEA